MFSYIETIRANVRATNISATAMGNWAVITETIGLLARKSPLRLLCRVPFSYPLHRSSMGRLSFSLMHPVMIRLRAVAPLRTACVTFTLPSNMSEKASEAISRTSVMVDIRCPLTNTNTRASWRRVLGLDVVVLGFACV